MNRDLREWLSRAGTPINYREWVGGVLSRSSVVVFEGPAHTFTAANWPGHYRVDPDDHVVVLRVGSTVPPAVEVELEYDDSISEEDWREFASFLDIDLGDEDGG